MKAAHLLSDIYAPTAKASALPRSTHKDRTLSGGFLYYIGFDDFAGGERVADRVGGAAAHLSAGCCANIR